MKLLLIFKCLMSKGLQEIVYVFLMKNSKILELVSKKVSKNSIIQENRWKWNQGCRGVCNCKLETANKTQGEVGSMCYSIGSPNADLSCRFLTVPYNGDLRHIEEYFFATIILYSIFSFSRWWSKRLWIYLNTTVT